MKTVYESALEYVARGWALVPIPPTANGTPAKGPMGANAAGWNQPQNLITTPEQCKIFDVRPDYNVGVHLGRSGLAVLDIDNEEYARLALGELGIDYDDLLRSAPRIKGSPGHDKAIFRAAPGIEYHKFTWPHKDTGAPVVVIEFRAGERQDVLPPSMHPDTGNPYSWAAPCNEIPEIPKPILTVWREWDRFKQQLTDICPWGAKRQAPAPETRKSGGKVTDGVIDKFNARYSVEDILTRNGYRRVSQTRLISPFSTTGLAGVTIFPDGRAYTHHGSDPWCDGHSHDAFGLYTVLEHGDSFDRALSCAREEVTTVSEKELIASGKAIADGLLAGSETNEVPISEMPQGLRIVPGILGEIVDVYNASAIKDQPDFAVSTAIALGSVVMGRRFKTDRNNYPSIYMLNIAKSSSGKEHIRTVITKTLESAGLSALIGPAGYTSRAGLMSGLISQPTHITIIDEFGKYLEATKANGNTNGVTLYDGLLQVYSLAGSTFNSESYSTVGLSDAQISKLKDRRVVNPALTLVGMTTPGTFYDCITGKDVKSGFVPRMLIIPSDRARQHANEHPGEIHISAELSKWLNECAEMNENAGNLGPNAAKGEEETVSHLLPPVPHIIPFTQEANSEFREFEKRIFKTQESLEARDMDEIVGKYHEIAMRVALIVARSCNNTVITKENAEWAISYVEWYMGKMIEAVDRHMAGSDFEALVKEAVSEIQTAGPRGLTKRELSRQSARYRASEEVRRKSLETVLADVHGIFLMDVTPEGAKGRRRVAFVQTLDIS